MPGAPLGPGEPTLRQAERRLLGAAASIREEAVREEHRQGGRSGRDGAAIDARNAEISADDAAAAEELVNAGTKVTADDPDISDVTITGDDTCKQAETRIQTQQQQSLRTDIDETNKPAAYITHNATLPLTDTTLTSDQWMSLTLVNTDSWNKCH